MSDIKTTVSTFWQTNSTLIIKIVVGIVVVAILVVVGWWYAGRAVDKFAADLRAQAIRDNRPLYDNLAVLKDRTQQLENQYAAQKRDLDNHRRKAKGGTDNAFNNPNKQVAASYFDNTIDSYIPGN